MSAFFGGTILKHVIIAEKPSVANEYAKVLGVTNKGQGYYENDQWLVTWAVGHLVSLAYPEKYDVELKEWKAETLPFIPDTFKYELIPDTRKQFQVIKTLYNREDIDVIYYAGDAGREGLYIQMLIRMLAGHKSGVAEKVVWIDSQTEDEIMRGISEAKSLSEYSHMSDAGYMRAIADYLVGINFSRLLSIFYAAMLNSGSGQKRKIPISVGRVMTCVLGMIVNREREIRAFRIKDFYRIKGNLNVQGSWVECEWRVSSDSAFYNSPKLYSEFGFNTEADALEFMDTLTDNMVITSMERKYEKKNAPLLFNLAELQGECTKVLHISPSETLSVVQSLYEKKLTTYPRTDARVLSSAIAGEIKKNLSGLKNGVFGPYAEEIESRHYSLGNKYVDDSKITDHYAIIPTGKTAKELSGLEKSVYEMIVRRFLAVFYPPAEFEVVRFEAKANNELFVGTNKVISKTGYFDVLGLPGEYADKNAMSQSMKQLQKGNAYHVEYEIKKGATAPPKRYTSGSMILAMENAGTLVEDDDLREQIKSSGIGTSATRADIIEKLIKLHYISESKQILSPSPLGEMIYEVVKKEIPELLSPEITAEWEKGLSQIAEGKTAKLAYQDKFYKFIREKCSLIKQDGTQNREDVKKIISRFATSSIRMDYKNFDSWNTKLICPLCGNEIETMEWGFKCKGNVNRHEGCNFSVNGDILGHRLLTGELAELLIKGRTGPFYDFVSQKNKIFAAYLTWNKETHKIGFDLTDMPWEKTDFHCPKCGKNVLKQGKYYKCADYIDKDHGCSFWIGKIAGKTMSDKCVEQLLSAGETDLICGFKSSTGNKFDAFLYLDADKNIKFRFPNNTDIQSGLKCPICNGEILETSNGFRCENYKPVQDRKQNDCSFYAGSILGHTIKKKELQQILSGQTTEPVVLKNSDKKSFEARLYWNESEKRIALQFDENRAEKTGIKCPLCNQEVMKDKYGYFCSGKIDRTKGCQFHIGNIAGVSLEVAQVRKLFETGKTDLISGFKPKEKGKQPFSAYLRWDADNKKIGFEFPGVEERREQSNYSCPICFKKMYKGTNSYYCGECGFSLHTTISSVNIPEEQIKKLLVYGRTDVISGFFSPTKRKLFSARLCIDKSTNKVAFSFLDMHKGGISDES